MAGEKITLKDNRCTCRSTRSCVHRGRPAPAPDIWRSSVAVIDAAVEKAYAGKRKIAWLELLAGEKAFSSRTTGCPTRTVTAFRDYLVGIKGPLTTPVGGGIRSLNVALRQMLDLYVCLGRALLSRRAVSGESRPKGRRGHLPREHRRHLRGHRIRRGARSRRRRC